MKNLLLSFLLVTSVSAITLNNGDVYTLTSDVYDTNLHVELNGGTLELNGFSLTIRDLSITAPSILDFGGSSELVIRRRIQADSSLSVYEFDQMIDYFYARNFVDGIRDVSGAPMNNIVFVSFSSDDTRWFADSRIGVVPEPSYSAVLPILFSIYFFRRKRS